MNFLLFASMISNLSTHRNPCSYTKVLFKTIKLRRNRDVWMVNKLFCADKIDGTLSSHYNNKKVVMNPQVKVPEINLTLH